MFKFKKIASILASTVMISSTVALAAASTYPVPFVQTGTANVAVVYGGPATALTDVVAASDIKSSLVDTLLAQNTASTTTSTVSVTGEAAPLFTGGTKLYVNDTLSSVRSTLTKSDLPTVLADNTFSGNVETKYTQTIDIGVNPILTFAKQPTTSDNPQFGYSLSTQTKNYIYNASVTFNKEVNFSLATSKGQDITLFGQRFTISSSTDATNLVLFKEAQKVYLDSTGTTSQEVTIGGKVYTIEMISASGTAATIKVTNDAGTSDQREITEGTSKKIAGLTVAVISADQNTQKYIASILAGAEKFTLTSGSAVTKGDDDTVIDGTKVTITKGGANSGPSSVDKITFSAAAPSSDYDALLAGNKFLDPVFGSFKVDFPIVNIGLNDTAKREDIVIEPATSDKIQVKMTDNRGNEKSVVWARNATASGFVLAHDDDGHNISVFEKQPILKSDYVVVGNEENGRLIELTTITNQTSGYSSDKVQFRDIFSGETYDTSITSDGTGSATIGGKTYTVKYYGTQGADNLTVTLDYPDSSGAGSAVLYPTIQTSLGAKVALYKPLTIVNATGWDDVDGVDAVGSALTQLRFPNGNGYTDFTVGVTASNVTVNGIFLNQTDASLAVGRLLYNASRISDTGFRITLINPYDGSNVTTPALIMFEEKDDNTAYQALITTLRVSTSKMGVNDVIRTWLPLTSSGTGNFRDSLASDSKKIAEADLFGSIITIDQNSADQYKATISYPDEQVYANVYVAAESAAFTTSGGTTPSGEAGNVLLVSDSEISSVSGKNLIVIGGSCINSVAATLLASTTPLCGADFTASTTVGAGQFLIQTFERTGGTVATLVAGYNAGDTTNAATYLKTQPVDATVGKKYIGTSSTSASLVSTTTTTTTTNSTNSTG